MNHYISPAAKAIIDLICREYALQAERAVGGWIDNDKVEGCLLERLSALSKKNPDLKAFLARHSEIPQREDEDPALPWAEDPREAMDNFVTDKTAKPQPLDRVTDENWIMPAPGERVC